MDTDDGEKTEARAAAATEVYAEQELTGEILGAAFTVHNALGGARTSQPKRFSRALDCA